VLVLQWVSSVERDSGSTLSPDTSESDKNGSPRAPHPGVAVIRPSLQLSTWALSTHNEADGVCIQAGQAVVTNPDIGKATEPSEAVVVLDSDGRHNNYHNGNSSGQEESTDRIITPIEKLPV
jgi:hypothetical protein